MSTEYIASLTGIIVSVLTLLRIEIGASEVNAVLAGLAAAFVIVRKIQKGEITVLGARK
jgi:hypothetical protein